LKVCGFTIVRNAIRFDYPIVESILSILPCVDEMVVAVGNSEDNTLDLIRSIDSPKIRIIETVWDDTLREGGRVLADETDKALAAIGPEFDWCFYIQADEVLHEKWIPVLQESMKWNLDRKDVQGLLFDYLHFYGTYDFIGDSPNWYRREIRVVRPNKDIRSYKDAQGFRFKTGEKLKVKLANATMHHYGWVRTPKAMMEKSKAFNKLWHSDDWVKEKLGDADIFNFNDFDSLAPFKGKHPQVMESRIAQANWQLQTDPTKKKMKPKQWLRYLLKQWFGIYIFEYKNYILLK
jgi:glycosyltransferase involved in cell wall biosynthesis